LTHGTKSYHYGIMKINVKLEENGHLCQLEREQFTRTVSQCITFMSDVMYSISFDMCGKSY